MTDIKFRSQKTMTRTRSGLKLARLRLRLFWSKSVKIHPDGTSGGYNAVVAKQVPIVGSCSDVTWVLLLDNVDENVTH